MTTEKIYGKSKLTTENRSTILKEPSRLFGMIYAYLANGDKPASRFKEVEHEVKIVNGEYILRFPNGFKFTNRGGQTIADRLRFVDFEFNYIFDASIPSDGEPIVIGNGDIIELSFRDSVVFSLKEKDKD